jgi:hypothetical protein
MRRLVRWIPIGVAGAFVACGNGDDNGAAVSLVDATTNDALAAPALLRVANWSQNLTETAVDVCLSAPGADTFQGPFLAAAFGPADGGIANGAGVSFLQASSYVSIAPGAYDIRFVAAGTADCTQGIGPDLMNAAALASGTMTTVALVGEESATNDIHTGLRVLFLADDGTTPRGKAAIRFINALPSVTTADGTSVDAPTIDFGTGVTTDSGFSTLFKPIYIGVPFGTISDKMETQVPTLSATAAVDGNGYGAIAAVNDVLTAHQSGTTFDLAEAIVRIAAGAAVTAVLLPLPCESDDDAGCPYPAELAVYVDNGGTVGPLSSCLTCRDGGP